MLKVKLIKNRIFNYINSESEYIDRILLEIYRAGKSLIDLVSEDRLLNFAKTNSYFKSVSPKLWLR